MLKYEYKVVSIFLVMTRLKKKRILGISEKEFSSKNILEGMIIRPAIFMVSFISFVLAMFLLIFNDLKWSGSLIIFAFILNLETIYKSLTDKPSIYRTMNLIFKLTMFISEIILFNYVIIKFFY